jgi:hypothetical protein
MARSYPIVRKEDAFNGCPICDCYHILTLADLISFDVFNRIEELGCTISSYGAITAQLTVGELFCRYTLYGVKNNV